MHRQPRFPAVRREPPERKRLFPVHGLAGGVLGLKHPVDDGEQLFRIEGLLEGGRGGADGAASDELALGGCVADVADVADVAGGNSGGGVAGAGSGESGVWHKTVICWLVLAAYLYIQCEDYAFAALPLLVFAASKARRER